MNPWWVTLLGSLAGVVIGGLIGLLQPLLKAHLDRKNKQLEADIRTAERRRQEADDALKQYHFLAHGLASEVDSLYEWATDADDTGGTPVWSAYTKSVSEAYSRLRDLEAAATALRFHYGPEHGLTEGVKRLTRRFESALNTVSGLSPEHYPVHQQCGHEEAREKVEHMKKGFAELERLIQERDALESSAQAPKVRGLLSE